MRIAVLVVAVISLLPGIAKADADDDTLRFYLSKSDLVVRATIVNTPIGMTSEVGVVHYVCELRVDDVIVGDGVADGDEMSATISRFEMEPADVHPLVAKDAECILFLKRVEQQEPRYVSADFWFAVQQPSPWMTRSLERIVEMDERIERAKKLLEDAARLKDDPATPRFWVRMTRFVTVPREASRQAR